MIYLVVDIDLAVDLSPQRNDIDPQRIMPPPSEWSLRDSLWLQVLDEDELVTLFEKLKTPMSEAELEQAMTDMDEDGDEVGVHSILLALFSHFASLPRHSSFV